MTKHKPLFIILLALSVIITLLSFTLNSTVYASGPAIPTPWLVDYNTPIYDFTHPETGANSIRDCSVYSVSITEGVWYAFGEIEGGYRHNYEYGPKHQPVYNLTGNGSWSNSQVYYYMGEGSGDGPYTTPGSETPPGNALAHWSASPWISLVQNVAIPVTGMTRSQAIFQGPVGATTLYYRWPDTNCSNNNAGNINDPVSFNWDFDRVALYPVNFDTVPPVSSHTLAGTLGNAGWYVSNVTVTITANDPADLANYLPAAGVAAIYLDAANYGGPTVISSQGPSNHDYYAVDGAQPTPNTEAPPHTFTLQIDTGMPVSTLASHPDGTPVGGTVSLSGSGTDATSGVALIEVSFDGGTSWQAATGTDTWSFDWDTTALSDGPVTLLTRATDVAGNVGPPDSGPTLMVDNNPPSVLITHPPDGETLTGPITITGTGSDGGGSGLDTCEVSFDDGATWETATGTDSWSFDWDTTLYPDGPITIMARCTDNVGQVSPIDQVDVILDNADEEPPGVSITTPTGGQIVRGAIPVTGTAWDDESGVNRVEVSADGGTTWQTASGTDDWSLTWDSASVPDGPTTLLARAIDNEDNVSEPASVDIIVDNTGPTTVITSPADGSVLGGNLTIIGTADDGPAGTGVDLAQCSFDNATWQTATGTDTWSLTWDTTTLPDGTYTLYCRAIDVAGNVGPPDQVANLVIDNGPASVSILDPLDGQFVTGQTSVSGTAQDSAAGSGLDRVEVSFDGGLTWQTASGTDAWAIDWDTTTHPDGPFTLYARGIDLAGNITPVDAADVIIDNTPPEITFLEPPANATLNGTTRFSGAANDGYGSGLNRVEVSFDGGTTWYAQQADDPANWHLDYDTSELPNGEQTVLARAIDNVGLIGQTEALPIVVNNQSPKKKKPAAITPGAATLAIIGKPDTAAMSDIIKWAVEVTNSGNAASDPLLVEVLIPDELDILEVVTVAGGYRVEGQKVILDLRSIPKDEKIHVLIHTRPNDLSQPGEVCASALFQGAPDTTVSDCVLLFPAELPETGGSQARRPE